MQKIRYGFIMLCMLLCVATTASAQVSIGIGLPNVSIGINLPLYPQLFSENRSASNPYPAERPGNQGPAATARG